MFEKKIHCSVFEKVWPLGALKSMVISNLLNIRIVKFLSTFHSF